MANFWLGFVAGLLVEPVALALVILGATIYALHVKQDPEQRMTEQWRRENTYESGKH